MPKTCNRCGAMNLDWDHAYHDATGKWKLMQHKNKYGKWCGKVPEKVMNKPLTKNDVFLCELCSESSFGLCRSIEKLEEHLKKYHPTNEILTDLDYMMMVNGIPKSVLYYWKDDPHYEKYAKAL